MFFCLLKVVCWQFSLCKDLGTLRVGSSMLANSGWHLAFFFSCLIVSFVLVFALTSAE